MPKTKERVILLPESQVTEIMKNRPSCEFDTIKDARAYLRDQEAVGKFVVLRVVDRPHGQKQFHFVSAGKEQADG